MKKQSIDTLVITATLGTRESLNRTLSSVRNIGGDRVKHVLVTTKTRYQALKEKYPELDVIIEPDGCAGIFGALNYAFKEEGKKYKYITFINDDDFWLNDFKFLFEKMDSSIDIDVVYGRVKFVNVFSKDIGVQTSSSRYKVFKKLLVNNVILFTQQATLMRSNVFFRVGGFDERYKLIADTKFWLKAIDCKLNFCYVNKICSGYTIHLDQLSSNKNLQEEEHVNLINEYSITESMSTTIELFLFRISNLHIYLNRLFSFKKNRPGYINR
jgi:GT2 family glycosyltransferase